MMDGWSVGWGCKEGREGKGREGRRLGFNYCGLSLGYSAGWRALDEMAFDFSILTRIVREWDRVGVWVWLFVLFVSKITYEITRLVWHSFICKIREKLNGY
jgi:hypothetical protein